MVFMLMCVTDFKTWVPFDLIKAGKTSSKRRIGGVASTETDDLEGESVMLKGMDISYLESDRAYFNWNHEKGADNLIGEVNKVAKRFGGKNPGLYVEGFLYKDHGQADSVFNLAKTLQKQSKRRLGFSVEGKIRQRDDTGKILRSWVKAIAITHEPVNYTTFAELIKSMNKTGLCCNGEGTCGKCHKALSAGHDNPPTSGGGALRVQSIEGDARKTTFKRKKKKKKIAKSLTAEEAVQFVLDKRPHLSYDFAQRLVEATKKHKQKKLREVA